MFIRKIQVGFVILFAIGILVVVGMVILSRCSITHHEQERYPVTKISEFAQRGFQLPAIVAEVTPDGLKILLTNDTARRWILFDLDRDYLEVVYGSYRSIIPLHSFVREEENPLPPGKHTSSIRVQIPVEKMSKVLVRYVHVDGYGTIETEKMVTLALAAR